MPENLQTIPAKHGTATFVPRGHTIKIINTYGKQIIETWAFALHQPPEEEPRDMEKEADEEEAEQKTDNQAQPANQKQQQQPAKGKNAKAAEAPKQEEKSQEPKKGESSAVEKKGDEQQEGAKTEENQEAPDPDIQAPEEEVNGSGKAPEGSAAPNKGWSSYIPSIRRGRTGAADQGNAEASSQSQTEQSPNDAANASQQKKGWSSYIPYGQRKDTARASQDTTEDSAQKKSWSSYIPSYHPSSTTDNTNSSKKSWSSYMPSGQGFSSYLPSRDAMASFTAAHQRDPKKSYAEQLYDFSKTPVGAGAISYATGSGYSSTLYSAYKAYSPPSHEPPPTEYLSLSHTREETAHLSPQKGDKLFTNLRRPILSLLEDTSGGGHATLVATCDPARAEASGEGWEEQGSCAENLVMALRALNESVGLNGPSAIGADVSVQIAPAPICLFLQESVSSGKLKRKEPEKRGVFVRFQALRDCVIVMSDCPQRGDTSKVGHFIVEEGRIEGEEEEGAVRAMQKGREVNEKAYPHAEKTGEMDVNMKEEKKETKVKEQPKQAEPKKEEPKKEEPKEEPKKEEPKKERKKPKKLERRTTDSKASSSKS